MNNKMKEYPAITAIIRFIVHTDLARCGIIMAKLLVTLMTATKNMDTRSRKKTAIVILPHTKESAYSIGSQLLSKETMVGIWKAHVPISTDTTIM